MAKKETSISKLGRLPDGYITSSDLIPIVHDHPGQVPKTYNVTVREIIRLANEFDTIDVLKSDGSVLIDASYIPADSRGIVTKGYVDSLFSQFPLNVLLSDGSVGLDFGYYPSSALSIATKEYTDDMIASAIGTIPTNMILSDGTVDMDLGYTPVNNLSVATKEYVDSSIPVIPNNLLFSDGSVDMDLGYTPVNALSIATKEYVDSSIPIVPNNVLLSDGTVEMDVGYSPTTAGAIATKSYVDANSGSTSQLERIDENGVQGWRLYGQDPNNYGDIGQDAVDLSISTEPSTVDGATATHSFAAGRNTRARNENMTAIGTFNTGTNLTTIFEIGVGTSNIDRKNALEVYTTGEVLAPQQTVDKITQPHSLVTKAYIDELKIDCGQF